MMQNRQIAKDMQTSLRGIANRAQKNRKARFGHLYTLLNEANLTESYYRLRPRAAAGVDAVTWADYGAHLEANIRNLVQRLKEKRYHAKLVRRKYIPKDNGKRRALGIPTIEDKLLQDAVSRILESIYETEFLSISWGYRPGKSGKDASASLAGRISIGRYHWIVDADIKGFFDNIDHDWMLRMLEHRINDAALLGLIRKWLKAGILEEHGRVEYPQAGTPQGGHHIAHPC
jgi:group II intron reverse transcriptase/maturase